MKTPLIALITSLVLLSSPVMAYDYTAPDAEELSQEVGLYPADPVETDTQYDPAPNDGLTFMGYGCTTDCSGHQAGYSWASENGVADPISCTNASNSFQEGCLAYVEGQGGAA